MTACRRGPVQAYVSDQRLRFRLRQGADEGDDHLALFAFGPDALVLKHLLQVGDTVFSVELVCEGRFFEETPADETSYIVLQRPDDRRPGLLHLQIDSLAGKTQQQLAPGCGKTSLARVIET